MQGREDEGMIGHSEYEVIRILARITLCRLLPRLITGNCDVPLHCPRLRLIDFHNSECLVHFENCFVSNLKLTTALKHSPDRFRSGYQNHLLFG